MFNSEEKSLKELIESKDNISEQLRVLRKYRNRKDVKDYIDNLLKNEYVTDYVRYMIDKYILVIKMLKREKKIV